MLMTGEPPTSDLEEAAETPAVTDVTGPPGLAPVGVSNPPGALGMIRVTPWVGPGAPLS